MSLNKKWRLGLGIAAAVLVGVGLAGYNLIQQARDTAQAYLFGFPLVMMEVTKQHQMLIELAVGLIADRGIDALSLSALARAAGVNRTTIYYHFTDRDALVAAVR